MKKFQKKTENFKCEYCGYEVVGNGYTDHCPNCLYSKHVDINPGDRMSDCGGLMKLDDFEIKHGEYVLKYVCLKCGYTHKVKMADNDNIKVLMSLIKDK
ncbi:MAG: RNHCP domain-containing protein [Candidatus Pacebacteria bacterium]|nr:RNHCP domain-containing protein [Candidatus Paceibacterota bacterium]MDD3808009.1 RNHCP domain-containing protein [Candidatus Paceibacterota bacterium]